MPTECRIDHPLVYSRDLTLSPRLVIIGSQTGSEVFLTVLDEASRLIAAGRGKDAVALVETAAARDDTEALHALANWRLYGLYGPSDLAATHALLKRGAALGDVQSTRLLARLIANGTGTREDSNAARALLGSIAEDAGAADELRTDASSPPPAPVAQPLADRPQVTRLCGFLSLAECAYLIDQAAARLRPSTIVDPATRRHVPHPFRTSLGTNFGPAHEDLVIRRINRRIAVVSDTPLAGGEPLHVLCYARGQEYRLHSDAVPGAANPRTHTLLIWLNDDFDGGETHFPAIDLSVRGNIGDALLFANLCSDDRPDSASIHAGLPVTRGRKWLATRWIRRLPVAALGKTN